MKARAQEQQRELARTYRESDSRILDSVVLIERIPHFTSILNPVTNVATIRWYTSIGSCVNDETAHLTGVLFSS